MRDPAAEIVVQLLQGAGGHAVAADLEELDADLVGRGIDSVEALGDVLEHGGEIVDGLAVVGLAVGDDDQVDWLDARPRGPGAAADGGLVAAEVRVQNLPDAPARGRRGGGEDLSEDVVDGSRVLDVVELGPRVEKLNVDTILVVHGADGDDLVHDGLDLAPALAGH